MSLLHRALLIALLLPLAGCGAGLVTAAVRGNNNGGGGSGPPSLSLPDQAFPLVPVPTATARTVVISNAQLAPAAGQSLQVQLRVHQGTEENSPVLVAHNQATPVILSGQGPSTVIGFGLDLAPIAAVTGTANDVTTARLAVLVDGHEVGRPVPVTLLRQPSLRLFDGPQLFLSPLGQGVRFAVKGLRSTEIAGIQVSVTTADPTRPNASVTAPCLRPAFSQPGTADLPLDQGEQLVTAEVPGNAFSGPARFFVDDAIAGRSEQVAGAFYRPDVTVATPAQGATGGGTKVRLTGSAMAPLLSGTTTGEPDFDRLEIVFRKGGPGVPERELRLADVIRAESTLNGLVFEMPPSPDGRPGNVGIVLRARIQATPFSSEVTAETVANGVFLYGNPEPVFSPRGIVLANAPIAVAPLALEGAPHSTQATDFGVLYSNSNFAKLQLLLSQENGMFIRYYGPELQIGNAAVDAEREPRDLVSGDFNNDGTPDLLIVNAGLSSATHQIVLGQPAPNAPLGSIVRISTPPGMAKARVADFDHDGKDDVVLFPGAGAVPGQQPLVLLQRTVQDGPPAFAAPIVVPVRPYATEAVEVADIDGDGQLDVAVAAAGTQMHLDVAYGVGNGNFAQQGVHLDLVVPGYTPAAGSPAAGLHALGAAPCTLALLLAGLPAEFSGTPPVLGEHPTTPPRLVQLRPNGPRSYAPVLQSDLIVIEGAIDPLRSSLAVNFDGIGAGRDELLVGTTGEAAAFSLGFFRLDAQQRLVLTNLLDGFDGKEKQIDAMFLGIAFPADPGRGQAEVPAVFMKHEVTVDGQLERRLSTLLLAGGTVLRLLSPDVGFSTPLGATQDLQGVVGGRFSAAGIASGGAARDLAAPATHLIQLGDNNGFGALAAGNQMVWNGLVPETTTLLPGPAGTGDSLAFIDDGTRDGRVDGQLRIGTWQPRTGPGTPATQAPTSFSVDLRPLLPAGLSGASIDPSSRLFATDVDGDQIVDLTVLLRFLQRRTEGEALLMVLRGRAGTGPGEFPFLLPHSAAITPVHGSATSFALGDFVLESTSELVRLELALAVPTSSNSSVDDGNHVRFYRLTTIAGDPAWRRSYATGGASEGARALIAGDRPTRLVASDMDGNGTVDLLVATDGDLRLRLFKNSGAPAPDPADVAIESFVESSGPPLRTPDGRQTNLLLGDINGDGNVDALLATEFTRSNGTLTSSVVYYLSSGTGQLSPFTRVSPTRLGDRDARLAVDLGDINSDGVPDLSIGWFPPLTGGAGGNNLIVLLGGSN